MNDQQDNSTRSSTGDFQRSVDRLESAVQELVNTARDQISGRASTFIDETTERLEREIDSRRRGGNRAGLRRGSRRRSRRDYRSRSRRLYRDTANQKICGVCAGLADYLGMETWLVRVIAVTGLIFLPHIVFPAYIVACFVMRKPTDTEEARSAMREDHSSPAPELGPKLSPRRSLRTVQSDLNEVELRLRRMESHITSGQYELQKELRKIEEHGNDG